MTTSPTPPEGKPKILVFDIETAPYLIYAWDTYKTDAIDIAKEWYMLCFAWAWYDHETQKIGDVGWVGMSERPGHIASNDKQVVKALWELLDAADIVIGQNHERFDIKKANERFLVHLGVPPSPYKTVDIRREYNRYFSGPASLKYMARRIDVAQKQSNRGWQLWLDCMKGDANAWREMEEYNKADVVATSEVYVKLLPWIGQPGKHAAPNLGHWARGIMVCPKCGHDKLIKRGFHPTPVSEFQTYQCKRCKGYSRARKREPQLDGGVALQ